MAVANTTPADPWKFRAIELAQWAYHRLVNRTDAFGQYRPEGGQQTVSWEKLDDVRLYCHFTADGIKGRVAGLHTTSLADTCKWIATDLDQHSDDPDEDVASLNLRDALRVADRMESIGIRPLVEDSNGAGGFHVWGFFANPIPCEHAYRIVRWCLQDCDGDHEAFPKQKSRHDTAKGFGNWLRIPGRHHKRDHWSRFYVSRQWIDGAEAVELLLSIEGSPINGIPDEATAYRPPAEIEADKRAAKAEQRRQDWQTRRDKGQLEAGEWDGSDADQLRLAREYASRYPPAISGHGGHNTTFALACKLRIGFDLSEHDTLALLQEWNHTCRPPWSDDELRHKAEQGNRGRGVRGEMLVRQAEKTRKGIVCDDTASAIPVETVSRAESKISIDEWREGPMKAKLASIGTPGVYFDGRPTGGGKSDSDTSAFKQVDRKGGRSLLILPTHGNCTVAEFELQCGGLDATKYPARLTEAKEPVCPMCEGRGCPLCGGVGKLYLAQNCWSRDADRAEALGLNVVKTICPTCRSQADCKQAGYLRGIMEATQADVSIATHARGAAQGISQLAEQREFVSVHENAVGLLRPSLLVREKDLRGMEDVTRALVEEPYWLDYFGSGKDEKQDQNRQAQYEFAKHFATVCESVSSAFDRDTVTTTFPPTAASEISQGFHLTLFRASCRRNLTLRAPAFRVLLDYAAGELHSLTLMVNKRRAMGESETTKTLLGVWDKRPPENKTIWFSDATGDADQILRLIGRPVTNVTPEGIPTRIYPPLQICHDITRTTRGKTIRGHLRFIMARYPESSRVGVITHRTAVSNVNQIGEPFKSRIVRVAYFGEGPDRASNGWYQTCDLLIVIGTPRVPPDAIRKHLVVCDKFEAAAEEPEWLPVRWRGERRDGQSVTIETRGYRHPDWREAQRELVRAAIVQAIGRGRALLPDGIPTVAVTVEECGAVIAPQGWESGTVSDAAAGVFEAMIEHHDPGGFGRKTLRNILEKSARKSVADRTLKEYLSDLRSARLVIISGAGKNTRWHVTSAWTLVTADEEVGHG